MKVGGRGKIISDFGFRIANLKARSEVGGRGKIISDCGFRIANLKARSEVGGRGKIISNCETGNPPEGWESEGQLRI